MPKIFLVWFGDIGNRGIFLVTGNTLPFRLSFAYENTISQIIAVGFLFSFSILFSSIPFFIRDYWKRNIVFLIIPIAIFLGFILWGLIFFRGVGSI